MWQQKRSILGGGGGGLGLGQGAAFGGASGGTAWDSAGNQAGGPVLAAPGRPAGAARARAEVHRVGARGRWLRKEPGRPKGSEGALGRAGGCRRRTV